MKIVLVLFTVIALGRCYSPFHKQRIGPNRTGPPRDNQWNNPWQTPASVGNNSRTLSGGIGTNAFDVMFQWNIMEFAYPSQQQRSQAINSQAFIPENVAPLGIAVSRDRVFVTTPRWNDGIPASLSTIALPAYSQSPALEPYPDWAAHTSTTNPDCSRLLSVYRLAIDSCHRLWIIDSGIVNALTNLQQLCPPKIVAYDLATDEQVVNYQFPADQVLQGSLHTNIVVDIRNNECNRAFVYVMDVWRNGVVVYDMAQSTSWRTTNHLYLADPFLADYSYPGIPNFQWTDGVFGASLSPLNKPAGDRVLFYHPMSSSNVSC
jgi:Major royal jelly protein